MEFHTSEQVNQPAIDIVIYLFFGVLVFMKQNPRRATENLDILVDFAGEAFTYRFFEKLFAAYPANETIHYYLPFHNKINPFIFYFYFFSFFELSRPNTKAVPRPSPPNFI